MAAPSRAPIRGAASSPLRGRRASPGRRTRRRPRPTRSTLSSARPRPATSPSSATTVVYSGPDEWSFRRLILHYAHLCKAAGGVDAFLIGSELRGLTTLRSGTSHLSLRRCAGRPRRRRARRARRRRSSSPMAPTGASISATSRPTARATSTSTSIRCGRATTSTPSRIDNYMPLADWRDGSDHLDAAAWDNGRSADYFRANVAGGEGFDWYYASDGDRDAQIRTPITDGAYGKPWVFRYKDLKSWWSEPALQPAGRRRGGQPDRLGAGEQADLVHRTRLPGGRQGRQPAERLSRPEVLGERHALLLDRRPRRPRPAPLPRGGAGLLRSGRSRLCRAAATRSRPVYGGRMVEEGRTHLWTWDARPYPAFPYLTDVWSDGANWTTGHWLTGRLGAAPASDLVGADPRRLRDRRRRGRRTRRRSSTAT